MGYFSDLDIEIRDLVATGASREVVARAFPQLTEEVLESYMADAHDGDFEDEDDGQPTEYEEWQDLYGGDDYPQQWEGDY